MAAKIKNHPRFEAKRRSSPRPKGVSDHAFAKVYWPFIPVFISVALLLTLAIQSVPLHHLTGRVLGYQTSESTQKLLADTNLQRQKAGEPALKINGELSQAAQAKANDMASRNYWSHDTPEGVAPWSFVTATGYVYQAMGENLAAGFSDDDAVLNAWMASPHHRQNILDASYDEVGFGYANNPNYTSAGGGPMTVVVAFYAEPASATAAANPASLASGGINTSGKTLGDNTSRVSTVIPNNRFASWAPTILILGASAAILLFIEKHRRYFKTAAVKSERYVLRHPLTDLGLVAIAGLVFLLVQTAGYIQ